MNDFSKIKDTITKEWLANELQTKTLNEVARELGVFPMQMARLAKKLEIPIDRNRAISIGLTKTPNHPTRGRERTEEERLKMSQSHVLYEMRIPEKEKQQRVKRGKELWSKLTPEEREAKLKKRDDGLQKAAKEGSKLELYICKQLDREYYIFEKHKKHQIPNMGWAIHFDIYIPDLRTIIEVNGPSHYFSVFGKNKLIDAQRYDQRKYAGLLGGGYIIIEVVNIEGKLNLTQMQDIWEQIHEWLMKISTTTLHYHEKHIKIQTRIINERRRQQIEAAGAEFGRGIAPKRPNRRSNKYFPRA